MQDEGLQEKMDAIRGRYKTAVSLLGLPDTALETSQQGAGSTMNNTTAVASLQAGLEF